MTGYTAAGVCSSPLISYSISLQQDDRSSNTQVRRTNGQGASNPGAPCSPFSPLGPFLPFFPFSPCGYNGLDKTSFILLKKNTKRKIGFKVWVFSFLSQWRAERTLTTVFWFGWCIMWRNKLYDHKQELQSVCISLCWYFISVL